MASPVRMPPLGTTSDELRVVEWLKAVGDQVSPGEPLVAVETDKATLEVEATTAGTLLRIDHPAGAVVVAGDVIAYIGAPGDGLPSESPEEVAPPSTRSAPVAASPAVRRLAEERGVDLSLVRGSGPGGRIEKRDVLELAEERMGDRDAVPPHRLALARRLERSTAVPTFGLGATVEMTNAAARVEGVRAAGVPSFGYTHLLLQALAAALRVRPDANCLWADDGPRLRRLEHPHVGLAVAGEDTLLVVTIPEPDRLSPAELVEDVEQAVTEARAGRISERYGAAAAVTLSNLGMAAVDRFWAILDPDRTCILAAGTVAERPAIVAGEVRAVLQLELGLTVDHRVLDGYAAALFLAAIRGELEREAARPSALGSEP